GSQPKQLVQFLAVGLSGVVVNTVMLSILTLSTMRVPYLYASIAATNVAILWNFVLLERFAFRGHGNRSFLSAFSRFWFLNTALLPVQLGLLALSVEVWAVHPVPANVAVLALVFVVRYVVTRGWVYRSKAAPVSGVVAATQDLIHSTVPSRGAA